ncbi:MAG: glycosyltransferase [Bacteroidia bacterium]|nr:glycosyltransferase [Bacteroidia bacterium]
MEGRKKVLIIAYYWPPSGGGGVQRWVKMVKYMREFGWEPVVYTPSNPESPSIDYSLLKDIPEGIEVIKTPIWEPYQLYKKFIGSKPDEKINAGFLTERKKPRLAEKISVWIRGNFFVPDARKFWIRPSVKFLSKYLLENKVDAIISTGTPHSMHLIGLGLKEKFNLPWIADFRDPWTNIDFYDKLLLTKAADAKHKKLEKKVLQNADRVSIVSWHWAEDLKKIFPRHVDVVTNGYDEDDFNTVPEALLSKQFSVYHIGEINRDRNPVKFWEAISELVKEREDFRADLKIKLIGKNDIAVSKSISDFDLESFVERVAHVPHENVIQYLHKAILLLLPLNNTPNIMGFVPGKLFEYLAARKPVLAIGREDGDSARIINETNSGIVCDFEEKEKIKKAVVFYYEKFKRNEKPIDDADISMYSRKNCCKKFVGILNEITN